MTRPSGTLLRYAASPVLWLFTLLYAMGVRFKNFAYDRRWLQPQQLSWPVVSVGNLSVGGTGKTPLVQLLADRLQQRGWTVDVLSRGYGRSSQEVVRVEPLGSAEEFGDEPLLLARGGLAVYVGASRYQPGQLAEQDAAGESVPSRRLHILDDGFQHRKLARAINLVLVQRADLEGDLLPAGRLREPLRALRRADICVLRAEDAGLTGRVLQRMHQAGQVSDATRVWIVERRTTLPEGTDSTKRAVAFCALGDPKGFFDGLRQAGLNLQVTTAFRDHHVYTLKDIEDLRAIARRCGAQCFVTTQKDSVRLSDSLRVELEKQARLFIARLEVSLQEEARCIDMLEARLNDWLQLRQHNVR